VAIKIAALAAQVMAALIALGLHRRFAGVREGTAGSHMATLDLTGLDSLVATTSRTFSDPFQDCWSQLSGNRR